MRLQRVLRAFRVALSAATLSAMFGCSPPPPPPVTTVTPAASEAPAKGYLLDDACPGLLAALAEAERACPDRSLTRSELERPANRDALAACAKTIDASLAGIRDPNVRDAGRRAAYVTRLVGADEVRQASLELADVAPSAAPSSIDPAYELARRQRAFAYEGARAWCARDRRREQPDTWTKAVEPLLADLQPAFIRCAEEARARAPLAPTASRELLLNWRAIVDREGRVKKVAQVDFPSTMRADLGLCILHVVEGTVFPKPDGEAVVGSNVTFVREASP